VWRCCAVKRREQERERERGLTEAHELLEEKRTEGE
jgi:hypothetical protein